MNSMTSLAVALETMRLDPDWSHLPRNAVVKVAAELPVKEAIKLSTVCTAFRGAWREAWPRPAEALALAAPAPAPAPSPSPTTKRGFRKGFLK